MYTRLLENFLKQKLFQGKAIIIVGARQTGKTTLIHQLLQHHTLIEQTRIFNCDNPTDRELLSNKDLVFLQQLIGDAKIVFIDEGQKVPTIGQTAKLLVDHYKRDKQIIITGSSSAHLLHGTEEALTGRKFVYSLFALSFEELTQSTDALYLQKTLEQHLIFGSYPDVVAQSSFVDKQEILLNLTSSYLYKDIFELYKIRHTSAIVNLLKALALQIGSEVSTSELASLIGIDKKTIERYIDLLEQNYIIFRLSPYTTHKRREIAKLKKIYFYDMGIRNAIINNFNFLTNRNDIGGLWENLIICERLKYQAYHGISSQNYFWRTYDGSEVDWVEERNGKVFGYEFKWNPRKSTRPPQSWQELNNNLYTVITPQSLAGFVL